MTGRARLNIQLAGGMLMLLALPFLVARLDSVPAAWSGEGAYLQGAKNVALYGKYALLSGGEFRHVDPILTGAGPTVLLPVAAVFRLFGVGLVQARVVSVLYALAAIWLCSNLAARMVGERAAVVATALMVWSPWGSFVLMGRLAVGQMPSLAFMLLGLYLWWGSMDRDPIWRPLGSGVALGLASFSDQRSIVVLGALLLVGAADAAYYRRLGFRRWGIPFLVAVLSLAVWLCCLASVGGLSGWLSNLQTYSLATVFRPSRVLANFNNLARSGYLLWAVPAIAYLGLEMVRKRRDGLRECTLLAVICVWLLWFVLGSIGWVLYAFVPISLSSLLLARLFGDVTDDFRFDVHRLREALGEASISPLLARCSLALIPLFAIGYGVLVDVDAILHEGNKSAQQMADYLDAHVASDALVETGEWEISFLSQKRFHHPPFHVLDALTRRDQLGVAPEGEPYSPEPFRPDYLVDGPWSGWARLYDEYVERDCALETAVGPYTLYACAQ